MSTTSSSIEDAPEAQDLSRLPSGHGPPSLSSHGPPSLSSHGPPSLQSHGPPSLSSRGQPSLSSHGPPSLSSQRPPSLSSHGPPSLQSHRPPSLSSHGPPSLSSKRPPSLSSQRPPSLSSEASVSTRTAHDSDQPTLSASSADPTTITASESESAVLMTESTGDPGTDRDSDSADEIEDEVFEPVGGEDRELSFSQVSESRRIRERERMRVSRMNESPDVRDRRQLLDRERHDQLRSVESIQEHRQRLQADSLRRILRSHARISDIQNLGLSYSPLHDYEHFDLFSIGSMDIICHHCQARRFSGEPAGMCCSNGKVRATVFEKPPEPYYTNFFSGETNESLSFLADIRKYNGCFQMTSFGTTGQAVNLGWQPHLRIQGQVYHRIGSLLPLPDREPQYIQVYFTGESEIQTDIRCSMYGNRPNRQVVAVLQELLDNHNQLIHAFKTTLDQMPADHLGIVIRADRTPVGEHERRFNAPTSTDEVAVLMVDGQHSRRDIVLRRRDQRLQRIDESHPKYDALQYPLILWQGRDSWHMDLREYVPGTDRLTSKRLSPKDYYCYQFMLRGNAPNFIFQCGKLLYQFAVDMYAKVESQRLLYIRLNQTQLRAEEYIHLRDAIALEGHAENVGQRVILPSTFIGSPRHLHEYTQDALSYVRYYGRPSLFITYTCNPSSVEFNSLLYPNQRITERHDLVARVFHQKVKKMMDALTRYRIFGETQCFMYTIEWQKRGLPHVHILLWLKERIHPDMIDSYISAEIPDRATDPLLFEYVTRHMIHGPCGSLNPQSECMKDRRCSKHFPRQFVDETLTGEDGYPLYRRRSPTSCGRTFVRERSGQQVVIDNSWVVPHNPTLLRLFNAHINVEYCHSVKSIKYVCKYINKGSDMAIFGVTNPEQDQADEVSAFQLGRYLCTNEAFWRLFRFQIHDRHPAVVQLAVHLENGQRVYFRPENAAAIAANPPKTTLMAFFDLNRDDAFARTILYVDVPRYYRWFPSLRKFKRRLQGVPVPGWPDVRMSETIGRVYCVSPRHRECFHLRLLLHHVIGVTSFQDLRTFDGRIYGTFREACLARGLLENDQQWRDSLIEACGCRIPGQIRLLFAMIICECEPSDPESLWNEFRDQMSDDFLFQQRRLGDNPNLAFNEDIYNSALIALEDICLSMSGKILIQCGFQHGPSRAVADPRNIEIARERSYNRTQLDRYVIENRVKLNDNQRTAYEEIVEAIVEEKGGLYFINAPGGTGKTFLINLILARIRRDGQIIIAAASSGIAATLLDGGRTAHSAFKIPLNVANMEIPICGVTRSSAKGAMLRQCKAIVWDECTMAHRKSLEALDRTLKDIKSDPGLFGGTVVILAGDFRQTLPIVTRGTPADQVAACLKQSSLWSHVTQFDLRLNMRVLQSRSTDRIILERFASALLRVGDGTAPVADDGQLDLARSPLCVTVNDRSELIDHVFPDLENNVSNSTWLFERAILAPKNDAVDELNLIIQDKLIRRRPRYYYSIDRTLEEEDALQYPIEYLNSLNVAGYPPHELKLKLGSPIILLRNLSPPKLCNGTRLYIVAMRNNIIQATLLSGQFKGESVFIPRIPLIVEDVFFKFKRLQFPIRLAYAMTVNKSQGQTLKVAGLELSTPCFSHGQLYVACSRVGCPHNLYVLAPHHKTRNVVCRMVL